ncbi:hypothetical protein FKP32DRAFT_1670727 [Trametes sanguinea]|nr:hypothetical protein FKP32DRAFT_1670834 [Trametes sanguinea]KAI9070075.1 hypothetical protein FKP32DRAFT_1670727 [Trametes sanguinea]
MSRIDTPSESMEANHPSALDPTATGPARGARRYFGTPRVYIPSNRKLSSTVTYSDLPDGYKTVVRELEVVQGAERLTHPGDAEHPPPAGTLVFSAKGWKEVVDSPESIAVLIVSHDASERAYGATLSITHRKLRHLLNDAVRWYMAAQGKLDSELLTVYVEKGDTDFTRSTLPDGLMFFDVDADGRLFQQPSSRRIPSPVPRFGLYSLMVTSACAIVGVILLFACMRLIDVVNLLISSQPPQSDVVML